MTEKKSSSAIILKSLSRVSYGVARSELPIRTAASHQTPKAARTERVFAAAEYIFCFLAEDEEEIVFRESSPDGSGVLFI